jgi:hypothetical protein
MSSDRIHPCQSQTPARRLTGARHEFRRFVLGPAVPGSTRKVAPRRRPVIENGCEFQPPVTHQPQRPEPGAIVRREQSSDKLQQIAAADTLSCPRALKRDCDLLGCDDCSTTPALRLPEGACCKTATSGTPSDRSRSTSLRRSNLKQPAPQSSKTDESASAEFLRLSIPWCTRVTCVPQDRTTGWRSLGLTPRGKASRPRSTAASRLAQPRESLVGMLIGPIEEVTSGVSLHRAYRCHRHRPGGAWSYFF